MGNYGSKDDHHRPNLEDEVIPSRSIRPVVAAEPVLRAQVEEPVQSILTDQNVDTVPTVFKWEHGGRNVYITGTFNNWERQIPMHRSGNDFTYVHNLKRGKHAFKFIVDDEWRYAPDQPTIADVDGRINNFIDVSDFSAYTGDEAFFSKSKERKIPDMDF
eukprot:gene49972-61169_t